MIFFKKKSAAGSEHEPDKSLIWALGILLIFGLIMLFSASWVVSYAKFGHTYHYVWRQGSFLLISLLFFFIAYRLDYRFWKKIAIFLLLLSIVLLILVFVPGLRAGHGASRSWIVIFGQSFQPAELVKIAFLIYLATWLEAKRGQLKNWTGGIGPFLVVLGVVSFLMMAQPDFGTLFIIAFTAMMVFFIAGGRLSHIFLTVLLLGLALFALLAMGSDYQKDRFSCLQDPGSGAQDKCYQVNQAMIAVGSGGLFGRGLGASRQKYLYLPEVWSDAIFPIIAEEIGFIFSALLILLYLFLFYRGLLVARDAPDIYGGALATGIVVWLAVQTFLNIGGMVNLIPMTGVPLPFVSAGGSAILSSLFAMGILINISRHTKISRRYGYSRKI